MSEFDQSKWLKSVIEFNTQKKEPEKSVDNNKKHFLRNGVDERLVNGIKDHLELVSRPIFVLQKILDYNLVAVHKIKIVSTLNKPAYAGVSILELNRTLIW